MLNNKKFYETLKIMENFIIILFYLILKINFNLKLI